MCLRIEEYKSFFAKHVAVNYSLRIIYDEDRT